MRQIELTGGGVTLVDDEDFSALSRWKWYRHPKNYAQRGTYIEGRSVTLRMHRVILQAPKGVQVDHINLNTLDNRRDNLRLATHSENQHNRRKYARNTSGFKGVYWVEGAWRAAIRVRGHLIWLGAFPTSEDAARAYDEAALTYHKEFARGNYL